MSQRARKGTVSAWLSAASAQMMSPSPCEEK